jgi:hypothetical protein
MKTQLDDILPEQSNLYIPVIIRGKENAQANWEENTGLTSLTKTTMAFTLNRSCQIGQLLSLEVAPEAEIHVATNLEKGRVVWAIIQSSTSLGGNESGGNYHTGVALIGDTPPASYFFNPLQYYRFSGVSHNGFWRIQETEKEFITRKYPRYPVEIEVYLGLLDDSLNMAGGEKVTTENISFGGAAAFTDLDLTIGDCVKFISAKHEFTALAVVRNIREYNNNKRKVHLEFVAGRFPMDKLNL